MTMGAMIHIEHTADDTRLASPQADNNRPLYNSRIANIYLDYIQRYRSDIEVDALMMDAGMSRHEVEDPGHWFSQNQMDRFQAQLAKHDPERVIPREAGRFSASFERLGAPKQYVLGFLNPVSAYLKISKISPTMTRGSHTRVRKLTDNSVEVISTPTAGTEEKPYQCQNRLGSFESVAKVFTGNFPKVEHTECFHKGHRHCRYIISWENTPALKWRQSRLYYLLSTPLIPIVVASTTGITPWLITFLWILGYMSLSVFGLYLEKTNLIQTLRSQGDAAKDLMEEINIRHSNALLIQEIGQLTSKLLDIEEIVATVMSVVEKHSHFDRGMIMLANESETRLRFVGGFGFQPDQADTLKRASFNLENTSSRGMLVRTFKEQKPFLVNDLDKVRQDLSPNSLEFAQNMEIQSFISVPIIYANKSIGVISVENVKKKKHLAQSEISLLVGVASQTAVSIENAVSFRKVRESEEKYRLLAENVSDVIWRIDIATMKFLYISPSTEKQSGYTPEEALTRNIEDVLTPQSLEIAMGVIAEELELDQKPNVDLFRSRIMELEQYHKDGSIIPIEITASFIRDNAGRPFQILGITRNITERKKAESDKRRLRLQLLQAQKMETVGRLAGGVAHDLNNILSGLVSYPDLLLMDLPEESPLRQPIQTIKQSGEKAATIVQDLLTLARRGVSVKEVVDLNQIVDEYLHSPEYKKLQSYHPRVAVSTVLSDDLFNIAGSSVHLSKTIMNLTSNAAEAMPEGGQVTITTENRYLDMPINGYDAIEEGEYVVLSVADTGIGISSEDQERIFEPFYTKKVMGRSGTGLGMAVVWGTVKDHKGYIDIHSTEGAGSLFSLYFPSTREALKVEPAKVSQEILAGKGESVLVIDDVQEQRDIASGLLSKLGYAVETVSSGEEALEHLKNHPAELLVLDMIMDPGMDGLETYERIIKLHPGQKAIIASGYSETDRVRSAQKLGAGAYVKKPYTLETIGMAIRNALDGN